ncbi:MAG: shikimate dehydrogenase [Nitrospiraceae bacterium]|nr:MAG: shikimate dehydrogenase [Nitrospiraceae bacterium]
MDVSGKTKIAGIFGYPIEHTLSPAMHNAAFASLGIDACYVAFRVAPPDLPAAVQAIRSLNMLGVNITVPHKEQVIPLLDEVNEEASFIGAVNTVTSAEGVLTGYNTDGRGFMRSLEEDGVDVTGKNVLMIGAGGASRAVSYYLVKAGAALSLYDVNAPRANKLATDLCKVGTGVSLLGHAEEAVKADIIINATPLGLKPGDPLPVNPGILTSTMVICDLVYRKTDLLREGDRIGAKTVDGSGMLLWQGALAFELWTGVRPPVDVMRKVLLSNIT